MLGITEKHPTTAKRQVHILKMCMVSYLGRLRGFCHRREMRQARAQNAQICVTICDAKRWPRRGKQQHKCASDRVCLSPNGREYFIFHSCEVSEGLGVVKIHLLLLFCIFGTKKNILLCVYLHMRTLNVKEWQPLLCIILLYSSQLGARAFCWN